MNDININLIRRCKNKESEAFHLLLARHEGYLYRVCFSYIRNKEDALDVIQEVFIKVFRNISSFDESKDFLPWLKKIAINTCINYLRTSTRHQHLSLDFSNDNEWTCLEQVAASDDVEDYVITMSMQEILRKSIELLPPGPRMVLTLHYMEDLSCQEIAELLTQPLGTVKNSLFRARGLLKKIVLEKGLLEV